MAGLCFVIGGRHICQQPSHLQVAISQVFSQAMEFPLETRFNFEHALCESLLHSNDRPEA